MTTRREAMLHYIITYKQEHDGQAPTIRDIMDALGISSTSVVSHHLARLEREGRIERSRADSRSIRVRGGRWVYDGEPQP